MSVDGKWRLTVDTPMGKQHANLELKSDGAAISGTVTDDQGTWNAPIFDASVEGDRLKFKVKFTKAMPMTMKFDAAFDENSLTGKVKMGVFGHRDATGVRV
ncbi:hypothetical protein [Actinomadura rubrisoli]|uniref:Uncharacterized protein n=1 Tax=Actinomadura rubrisoli TaxID=2530368 RepID=A0A4R5C362_9ACTN|nr:hypothetical protein [Actinomadura rubrisoli]TDD92483.1 hypothetical protein E1298_10720 [Actinomadura rubrisoli]